MADGKWWRRSAGGNAAGPETPAARTADAVSLPQIYELYGETVLRVARRILLNPADAEDAAQTVFLKLSRDFSTGGSSTFDASRELLPWLYRVTVNAANDLLRSRPPSQPIEAEPASRGLLPDQQAFANQQAALLYRALERLTERERECIVLRDLEGLTTAEVAGILGAAEATVRSYISTGRVKLRACLELMEKRR